MVVFCSVVICSVVSRSVVVSPYRGCFLLALVRAPEDVERAAVDMALVDVHAPQVDVNAAGAPIHIKKEH